MTRSGCLRVRGLSLYDETLTAISARLQRTMQWPLKTKNSLQRNATIRLFRYAGINLKIPKCNGRFPNDIQGEIEAIYTILNLTLVKEQSSLDVRTYSFSQRTIKVKVLFYIALYPVRWTAKSALHFPPPTDLFIPTPFSASLGSILAMQQLRNDYSLT